MAGEEHIGGEKLICDIGCIAQIKSTIKTKHFTVIGLTNLHGEPIFYVISVEDKEQLFDVWDGIDLSKDKFGY